jgi:Type II site-specific deoxyribonuclease
MPTQGPEALAQAVASLTPRQQQLLQRMADALAVPVAVEIGESDLVDAAFAETLANFLLLHHAIHEEPLNKAAFEYVLKGCAEASGHVAEQNAHRGTATWDVKIDDTRWSLKTEAALRMSPSKVRIEKLMEARWIRDCTNPAKCAAAVRREIPTHMAGYDRILMLRAFRHPGESIVYELIEPPKQVLFDQLTHATAQAFTKEGSKESYGADFSDTDGERIFRILLDSSVEKIRLWFSAEKCIRHGTWTVTPSTVQEAAIF